MNTIRAFMRWFATDKRGWIVIVQAPNAPLLLWVASSGIAMLTHGSGHMVAVWAAHVALLAWAVLELISGASPFRRVLGALVASVTILQIVLLS